MVPNTPTGTFTQNTARQSHAASSPPGDQTDELPGERGDLVDAEREAALVGRERVGEDRGRVRGEHRSADGLQQPPADQPQRAARRRERVEGQQDRRDGEDGEAGVVDPDPAEHVAEPAER